MMSRVLVFLFAAALIFGAVTGRMGQVSQATIGGAQEAVRLLLSIGGSLCLWSGLMEVMDRSGLSRAAARLLRPFIGFLFREDANDREAQAALSQNMSANLLGLGSAATPAGLRAAARLHTLARQQGRGDDAVYLLIVLNTASLQLFPTTVAAVRASYGARSPYDILPAVWLASAGSVAVGI
ncbi:MAG: spore maturation protein A, partial [Clostridia bacterium]|nr:spore maturation protein A [Clostridia bacterium]